MQKNRVANAKCKSNSLSEITQNKKFKNFLLAPLSLTLHLQNKV